MDRPCPACGGSGVLPAHGTYFRVRWPSGRTGRWHRVMRQFEGHDGTIDTCDCHVSLQGSSGRRWQRATVETAETLPEGAQACRMVRKRPWA